MSTRPVTFRAPEDVRSILDEAQELLGKDRSAILNALIRGRLAQDLTTFKRLQAGDGAEAPVPAVVPSRA